MSPNLDTDTNQSSKLISIREIEILEAITFHVSPVANNAYLTRTEALLVSHATPNTTNEQIMSLPESHANNQRNHRR